ncbi:MAG: 2-oxoacid:acceptor oxidoreductase family protein [Deltaproteobacteria bacterium]|nr:2-oxoacid:acceptor oxidoreductase family protein [Deltaproteobacteria bacterium]MBI3390263.1 2-oxoacid:acceptor oxidoreductase family protein [Deltaproteobacteria bacterium]
MEREIIFTGIGGQGIQLMAKVLAQAAATEGKHAMLFGVYGGAMRGSASESTLVIGADEIQAPPIVPQCWSVVAMHPKSLATLMPKLRSDGQLFLNQTLVPEVSGANVPSVAIPATRLAEQAGSMMGAGMIMLGAFAEHTRLVGVENLVTAMRASLPAHRQQLADKNAQLLIVGANYASAESRLTTHDSRA